MAQKCPCGTFYIMNHPLTQSDFSHLTGTNCYCSEESAAAIRQAVSELPLNSVHFIGTGDYHYISLFWAERIREPFRLVLFDNHPDDQPSAFGGDTLSCGSWVRDVRALPLCAGVHWIRRAADGGCLELPDGLPLYLSIDLDVLSVHYAHTDWDQGDMTLDELCGLIRGLKGRRRIIGADICGGLTMEKGASAEDLALNAGTAEAVMDLLYD